MRHSAELRNWSAVAAALALLVAACGSSPQSEADPSQQPWVDEEISTEGARPASSEALSGETPDKRKERLREKAETDPEGADAEAIGNMGQNEVVATAINSAGYLCARVTDMYLSAGAIIAHCVEYRSGSGRVKYRVDANAGTVEPL